MTSSGRVELTEHAKLKLRVLRRHGFVIREKDVVEAVIQSDRVVSGRMGRLIA